MSIIEPTSATIDTLAVTIKALHVNSKQMTLAVFRQLPQLGAYTDHGTLAPGLTHWGLVRYEIKDEGSLWLVASADDTLFRCLATPVNFSQYEARGWIAKLERELVAHDTGHRIYATPQDATAKKVRLETELTDARIHHVACKTAEASFATLKALPQLFIAL